MKCCYQCQRRSKTRRRSSGALLLHCYRRCVGVDGLKSSRRRGPPSSTCTLMRHTLGERERCLQQAEVLDQLLTAILRRGVLSQL